MMSQLINPESLGTQGLKPSKRRQLGTLITGALIGALSVASVSVLQASPAQAADECSVGVMARIPGPPPALAKMGLSVDENRFTGAGVTVAIIDSGIDASRPQLENAFAPGSVSLISDGERTDGLGDPQGHGTALAGIIAARPEPGSGVIGVAPEARIISLRVFRGDDEESKRNGFGPDSERIATAIRAATNLGADIITVALSDDVDTSSLREATAEATARGSLVVASAGNRNTTQNTDDSPRYPAAYPDALAVTAVDDTGVATSSSIHGEHVDVAAPGQNVLTTATGGGDCIFASDAPSSSFATAYTAGAAALLAEAYPNDGPEGWAYRLKATADRPNPDSRDNFIGWGAIRPEAALNLRPSASTRGPVSPFADTSDSRITPPTPRVASGKEKRSDSTVTIAITTVAAGLITISTLGALLRRKNIPGAGNITQMQGS